MEKLEIHYCAECENKIQDTILKEFWKSMIRCSLMGSSIYRIKNDETYFVEMAEKLEAFGFITTTETDSEILSRCEGINYDDDFDVIACIDIANHKC